MKYAARKLAASLILRYLTPILLILLANALYLLK